MHDPIVLPVMKDPIYICRVQHQVGIMLMKKSRGERWNCQSQRGIFFANY
jgi:hypothetical protein